MPLALSEGLPHPVTVMLVPTGMLSTVLPGTKQAGEMFSTQIMQSKNSY